MINEYFIIVAVIVSVEKCHKYLNKIMDYIIVAINGAIILMFSESFPSYKLYTDI